MAIPRFQAWTYASFAGKLEKSLELSTITTPEHFITPKSGKVLVEVLASSLNPADYKIPESPIESRVVALRKPASPGMDFCGRLVMQPQRLVFGRLPWPAQYGTLSQYILVTESDLVDVPNDVNILQAAALPIAALTAYQSLAASVKSGDRVLINGGSGGVGTFTIQIAKILGCYVVATCSSRNAQFCKDLGADEVVEYTKGDIVTQLLDGPAFDALIDNVGADPSLHKRSAAIMRPAALFVLVSGMLGSVAGMLSMAESLLRPRWLGGCPIRYTIVLCQPNKIQLQQIAEWVSQGKLRVIIDHIYGYKEVPTAFAELGTGRTRGKIIIKGAAYEELSHVTSGIS